MKGRKGGRGLEVKVKRAGHYYDEAMRASELSKSFEIHFGGVVPNAHHTLTLKQG
jgi:hypothetical protein